MLVLGQPRPSDQHDTMTGFRGTISTWKLEISMNNFYMEIV